MLQQICTHTYAYADICASQGQKLYYMDKDGAWFGVTINNLEHVIALQIYMGLVLWTVGKKDVVM